MKNYINLSVLFKKLILAAILPIFIISSCNYQEFEKDIIEILPSESLLNRLNDLGFVTEGIKFLNFEDNSSRGIPFLIENDIIIHEDDFKYHEKPDNISNGRIQQYATIWRARPLETIVPGRPSIFRPFKIIVGSSDPKIIQATDIAINRYNSLNLKIKFERTSLPPSMTNIIHIYLSPSNQVSLAAAGFPNMTGLPYNQILFNPSISGRSLENIASIIAHEIGHTIGLRHTDFMNRSFSCFIVNNNNNEGNAGVGAIHISGTPTGPDPESFMLACIGQQDRPFNPNDIITLNTLFGF